MKCNRYIIIYLYIKEIIIIFIAMIKKLFKNIKIFNYDRNHHKEDFVIEKIMDITFKTFDISKFKIIDKFVCNTEKFYKFKYDNIIVSKILDHNNIEAFSSKYHIVENNVDIPGTQSMKKIFYNYMNDQYDSQEYKEK